MKKVNIEEYIESGIIKELIFSIYKAASFKSHFDVAHKILMAIGSNMEEVSSKSRKHELAMKRHLFIFLMYNLTRLNLVSIAKLVNRDHSTMINSRKAIVDEINYNKAYERGIKDKLTELYDLLTKETKPVT